MRMKMKLKKGDQVVVISGKDKGKTGQIVQVLAAENRVVVEGIAMIKRHVRKTRGQAGQIIERPQSIHASNVMFMDPKEKKGTRIGRKVEDGKIVRVAKKSGTTLS